MLEINETIRKLQQRSKLSKEKEEIEKKQPEILKRNKKLGG